MLTHQERQDNYQQFFDVVSHFFDDPSVRKEAINHGVLLLLLLGALLALRTTSERTAQGKDTHNLEPLIVQTHQALMVEIQGKSYIAEILHFEQCGLQQEQQCAFVQVLGLGDDVRFDSVPLSELQYQQTE